MKWVAFVPGYQSAGVRVDVGRLPANYSLRSVGLSLFFPGCTDAKTVHLSHEAVIQLIAALQESLRH